MAQYVVVCCFQFSHIYGHEKGTQCTKTYITEVIESRDLTQIICRNLKHFHQIKFALQKTVNAKPTPKH